MSPLATATNNLPAWTSAAVCYSRAYKLLAWMGQNGHITQQKKRGKAYCTVSVEMQTLIDALNKGDEECIKYFLSHPDYINVIHTA